MCQEPCQIMSLRCVLSSMLMLKANAKPGIKLPPPPLGFTKIQRLPSTTRYKLYSHIQHTGMYLYQFPFYMSDERLYGKSAFLQTGLIYE